MSRRTTKANTPATTTRQGVIQRTGEVVAVDFPVQHGRRRRSKRKVYAMVDLVALDQLELTALQWRVLHRIMRSAHPETNEARVTVDEIGRDLGIHRQSASRTLRQLRERRIVATHRIGVHQVNPHIVFRGSNQDWDTATEHHPEPIWRAA